jgi:hypothetical protein
MHERNTRPLPEVAFPTLREKRRVREREEGERGGGDGGKRERSGGQAPHTPHTRTCTHGHTVPTRSACM